MHNMDEVIFGLNMDLIVLSYQFCNRWHNCFHLGLHVISSHIFKEGNDHMNEHVNHGHYVQNTLWLKFLPNFIREDFFKNCFGLPNFHFP